MGVPMIPLPLTRRLFAPGCPPCASWVRRPQACHVNKAAYDYLVESHAFGLVTDVQMNEWFSVCFDGIRPEWFVKKLATKHARMLWDDVVHDVKVLYSGPRPVYRWGEVVWDVKKEFVAGEVWLPQVVCAPPCAGKSWWLAHLTDSKQRSRFCEADRVFDPPQGAMSVEERARASEVWVSKLLAHQREHGCCVVGALPPSLLERARATYIQVIPSAAEMRAHVQARLADRSRPGWANDTALGEGQFLQWAGQWRAQRLHHFGQTVSSFDAVLSNNKLPGWVSSRIRNARGGRDLEHWLRTALPNTTVDLAGRDKVDVGLTVGAIMSAAHSGAAGAKLMCLRIGEILETCSTGRPGSSQPHSGMLHQ